MLSKALLTPAGRPISGPPHADLRVQVLLRAAIRLLFVWQGSDLSVLQQCPAICPPGPPGPPGMPGFKVSHA